MNKVLKKIDEFNNIHYVEKNNELGRGGQGVVYKTKNADTVIKIVLKNDQPIKDKKEIQAFHQKIKKLIYKPLPNDINIAKPLAVLQNEAGYVMNLLDGMYSLAELLPQELSKEKTERLAIPIFLKEFYKKNKQNKRSAIYIAHYLHTGGLRKRLYTLSRLAVVLYRLHSRGIVYFDISHNNIFINNDEIPLVYLIDADNIEYESVNKSTVYTPNFEVPEIVRGEPNSTYSDIYAFGILSYLTLTTTHPFDGIGLDEADIAYGKIIDPYSVIFAETGSVPILQHDPFHIRSIRQTVCCLIGFVIPVDRFDSRQLLSGEDLRKSYIIPVALQDKVINDIQTLRILIQV